MRLDRPQDGRPPDMDPAEAFWIWEQLLRDGFDFNYKMLIERLHSGARRFVIELFFFPFAVRGS
jgi:hypothetical protein